MRWRADGEGSRFGTRSLAHITSDRNIEEITPLHGIRSGSVEGVQCAQGGEVTTAWKAFKRPAATKPVPSGRYADEFRA
jgi:hypothetical protein